MSRIEMVKARTEELSKLSDMELVNAIVRYFRENATMPGEKAIKDYALDLKGEFDGNVITGLLSQVRSELVEEFASLLVKEVKLRNVQVLNDTKKNRDLIAPKASDLPMTLSDTRPVPVNVMRDTYEMPGSITAYNTVSITAECKALSVLPGAFASLPAGFIKNHKALGGMECVIEATDYSNGNFANMGYRMLVDLGQNLAA